MTAQQRRDAFSLRYSLHFGEPPSFWRRLLSPPRRWPRLESGRPRGVPLGRAAGEGEGTVLMSIGLGAWAGGVAAMLGAGLIYLSSPNQRWRANPLGRIGRWLGVLFLLLALIAFALSMGLAAAVATWAVAVMILFTALPFLGLLGKRRS